MAQRISTFLMFEGKAGEALRFYASLFEGAEIDGLRHYGPGEGGPEGGVMSAALLLKGQRFMVFDSPAKHQFGFTPAISLFVDCDSEAEIDRLAAALGEGGTVMMPLAPYPFAAKFTWVSDRFGVSWQLSLANP